jgi:hypothetical protein
MSKGTYKDRLTLLSKEERRIFLHMLRCIIVDTFPDLTKNLGLEKAEEIVINLLDKNLIKLITDRQSIWLEITEKGKMVIKVYEEMIKKKDGGK